MSLIDHPRRALQKANGRWLLIAAATICVVLAFSYHGPLVALPHSGGPAKHEPAYMLKQKPKDNSHYSATVVAGLKSRDFHQTSWLTEVRGLDRKIIYSVDDVSTLYHLDKNHGRESMVYLKYILDHWQNLTDVTFFIHGAKQEYHNNLLLRQSTLVTLNRARRAYIEQQGYTNLRCDLHPGCPRFLKLDPTPGEHDEQPYRQYNDYSTERWKELFPDAPYMPSFLAAPCCAQFAVSRQAIESVPKATYQRLAEWLSRQDVFDGWSGRFMEMAWHYIFTGRSELCPPIADCYCSLYGMCGIDVSLAEEWLASQGRFLELQDRERILRASHDKARTNVEDDPELAAITVRLNAAETRFKHLEELLKNENLVDP